MSIRTPLTRSATGSAIIYARLSIVGVLAALLGVAAPAFGQTNPQPQPLPYSQDFSALPHSATEYPDGWQGWRVANSIGATYRTDGPSDDEALVAEGALGSSGIGVYNYDGKLGFLVGGSANLALALAISTTGQSNVLVSYDAMVIRNPGTRINEMGLQYRVGEEGSWTTLEASAYRSTMDSNLGNGDSPQNIQLRTVMLPAEAEDQQVVQLRWISREISGSGSRPSFAVDNIEVAAFDDPIIITSVDELAPFATVLGWASDAANYLLLGYNLTENIVVTAPSGFELSEDGDDYFGTLTFPPDGGVVEATVFVRLTGDALGEPDGEVSHTSAGADPRAVAVSGSVVEPVPTIMTSVSSLPAFHTEEGEPSAVASYTVSGEHLEGPIILSAPAGFELSDDGTSFGAGLSIPQSNGFPEATVYVRLIGDVMGAFSGDISHVSDDAETVDVAVSGTVVDPALDVYVTADPTVAQAATLFPNDSWYDTGIENDWRFDDADLTFYLLPRIGGEFFAVNIVVTWEADVLQLDEVGAGEGLFAGSESAFAFFHDPLGAPNSVTINASRLDNQNFVIANLEGGDQYVAALTFNLLAPGQSEVEISSLDFRAVDGMGGQSTVDTRAHNGTLKAFLGDVGTVDDESTGDGLVDFEDLMLFSDAYWSGVPGGPDPEGDGYKYKYDVGPTQDGTVFSLPLIDNQIQFEDLVIFSISYGMSNAGGYGRTAPGDLPLAEEAGQPHDVIRVGAAPARVEGDELRVPIAVSEVVDLRALSLEFDLDSDAFEVVGTMPVHGDLLSEDMVLFSAAFGAEGWGMADAATMGGAGLSGAGEVFEVRLRPRTAQAGQFEGAGDVLAIKNATLRNSHNIDFPVEIGSPQSGGGATLPETFSLDANYPNPFDGSTTITFALPEASVVRLTLYDTLGRAVMVLADGEHDAGVHRVVLEAGGLASGAYIYRIEAGAWSDSRRMVIVR